MRKGFWPLFVAALLYLIKFLAELAAGNQVTAFAENPFRWLHGVAAMIAPHSDLLTGMSIGIVATLIFGYWERIVHQADRIFTWAKAVIWLARKSYFGEHLFSKGAIWLYADTNFLRDEMQLFTGFGGARVIWWPQDKVFCDFTSPILTIQRIDHNVQENINVRYEIRGRMDFWRTIQHWRDTDEIGRLILNRPTVREFKARMRAKAADRARQSRQGTGTNRQP